MWLLPVVLLAIIVAPTGAQLPVRPAIISKGNPELGKTYSLTCLTDKKNARIDWFKHFESTNPIRQNTDSLYFGQLRSEDQKRYRCRVTYSGGTVWSDYFIFYFISYSGPSLEIHASSDEVNLGLIPRNPTFISCHGSYNDFLNLYKDGMKTSTIKDDSRKFMVFSSGKFGHFYWCTSSTRFAESKKSSHLYFDYLYGEDEMAISASSPTPVLGEPLNLTCTAKEDTNQNRFYSLIIYKFNGLVEHRREKSFMLDPLTKEDEGIYVCSGTVKQKILKSPNYFTIAFSEPDKPKLTPNQQPSRENGQTIEVFTDSFITLNCQCGATFCDPKNYFRLYKNGVRVKTIPYEDKVHTEGKLSVTRTYTLNPKELDIEGTYTCTISNSVGESKQSDSVSFSLKKPEPKPVISVDNQYPTLGENITFVCKPQDGATYANYQFVSTKTTGSIRNVGNNLTLYSVTPEDTGYYSCAVPDKTGPDYSTFLGRLSDPIYITLRKPAKPQLKFIIKDPLDDTLNYKKNHTGANIMYKAGAEIHFSCRNFAPGPGESYTLYESGYEVEFGNTLGQFTVPGHALGEYEFRCKATNRLGDSEMSDPLTLHVINPAIVSPSLANPTLGSNLTLTCDTEKQSNDNDILWFKNGISLPFRQKVISLPGLTQYNEGEYSCQHSFRGWLYPESEPYLIVFGDKAVKPEVYTYQESTLEEGVPLTVYCLSDSTTSHHAKFYLNGNEMATVTEKQFDDAAQVLFTYKIPSTTASDFGDYTCTVENSLGESDHSDIEKITMDIDECNASPPPCADGEDCWNTVGSYSCSCKSGFMRNSNNSCVDIDECSTGSSPCGANTDCVNTMGSYSCICKSGFQKNALNYCIDINECNTLLQSCGPNGECRNTMGSYSCFCKPGFLRDSANNCVDIDECLTKPCGTNQTCTNTEGSYICKCPDGYALSKTGECEDINECQGTNPCQQQCTNTVGGYTCSCFDSFVFNSAGKCIEIFVGAFELRFPNVVPSDSMLTDGTEENKALKKELTAELTKQLQPLIGDLIDVLVKKLRRGSLNAEIEVIVDKESNTNAAGDAIAAGQNMNLNNITVNGTKQDVVEVVFADTVVTYNSDPCVIRQKAFPCDGDHKCIVKDGISVCKGEDNDDKTGLYIGIGVGVAALLIIGVVGAVCFRRYKQSKLL